MAQLKGTPDEFVCPNRAAPNRNGYCARCHEPAEAAVAKQQAASASSASAAGETATVRPSAGAQLGDSDDDDDPFY